MKQKIFFHGTKKEFIKELLDKGLITNYGRATLTTNPKYSISFSSRSTKGTTKKIEDYSSVIREGALIVFKIPGNQVKIAKESNIILKKKNKIITGWPNRYKTEQYGYYPLKKIKKVCIDKKYIVAAFAYSPIFLKILDNLAEEISDGRINEVKIKDYTKKLEKILSNKKIQLEKPNMSLKVISSSMVYGMIRNLVLRDIRQSYLSIMKLKGWDIINYGNHPVKLKNKKEIDDAIKNIGRIIRKKFVPIDIRRGYYRLLTC